jgi:cytochrome c
MKHGLRFLTRVGVTCAVAAALAGCGEDRDASPGAAAPSSSSSAATSAPPPADATSSSAATSAPPPADATASADSPSSAASAPSPARSGEGAGANTKAEALAKQATCLNCHAVDAKKVGPAFKEVAKKYKGTGADKLLADMKSKPVHQAAVKATSEQDLKTIASWIVSM